MPNQFDRAVATIAGILILVIVLFQAALALGVPWGQAAYGGRSANLDPAYRIASAVAVVFWTGVGLTILRVTGFAVWSPIPARFLPVAGKTIIGILLVAAVLNAITPSRIERAIWLPTTLMLLTCVGAIVLRRRP